MRYLVISDIHANLQALETVLASAGEWDAVLFLGDLVGYGPSPNECVERVVGLSNVTSIIGNHDVAALGQIDVDTFNPQAKFAALWTQKQLTPEHKDFLGSLGQVEELEDVTLVHGSPRDPVWEYLDRVSQGPENFARFTTTSCFNGHTHVPRIFSQDTETRQTEVRIPEEAEVLATADGIRRIINPGSVGQPRDGDPRAAFALYDSDSHDFEFRRVEYDIETVQSKMEAAGLPKPLSERLAYGF
jgi:diadenosine tetraphosphatase ApaH/serine/threonine PP2A family protein phosphatase